MIRFLAALALIVAAASASAEDFPYDQFARTTLHAIVEPMAQGFAKEGDSGPSGSKFFDPRITRNVVRAIYRGEHRPVDSATAAFLKDFEATIRAQQSLAGLYQDEYLFSDDGVDYWLPVQAPVATHFAEELKPGDAVDLYLVAAGAVKEPSGWKLVLTVEEFDSGKRAPR